ncbi:hypothetical protein Cs308_0063 [Candidatus Chlamydia sanziniae]|uniref:Uncharacterized protein n=1 Tax=Candidatus Chlamydia sanziniae TaxID=1806891 RepID=A0A1A9HTC6_9CHLA|nr:hypothetical protein Cs308_0063 [Candidatus Chlamydia sanziniae]
MVSKTTKAIFCAVQKLPAQHNPLYAKSQCSPKILRKKSFEKKFIKLQKRLKMKFNTHHLGEKQC